MTSNDDSRDGKPSSGSHGSGKRPHATLDLKAVTIKDRSPKSGASDETAAEQSHSKHQQTELAGSKPPPHEQADAKAKQSTGSSAPETKSDPKSMSPPTPPVKRRRGGIVGPLFAGIIGGLLAMFGGDYAWNKLGLPKIANSATRGFDAIELRLADIEQQITEGTSGDATAAGLDAQNLDAITSELEALKALSKTTSQLADQQSELRNQIQALKSTESSDADAAALTERLEKLEQQIGVVSAAAQSDPNAGPIPQIAALSEKLSELEIALARQASIVQAPAGLSDGAEQRIAGAVASASTARSEAQRLAGDFAAVKSTSNRLDQRVSALQASSDKLTESLRILNETTLKMSSEISTLRSELTAVARPADINAAVTPYKDRIAQLEKNLKALEQAEVERAAQARSVVLSLELAELERALNSGEPFVTELSKVKASAGSEVELSALESYAARGVPTLATLQANFRPLIHPMMQASPAGSNESLLSQLVDQAKSVVRVRKVTHDKDDNSVEAVIARLESDLKQGNLQGVLSHAGALPAENKAPAKAWLAQVAARASVDQSLQRLQSELKASLRKTSLTLTP